MTELIFILDRSGSMAGLEADTVGGFNAMLAKQKGEPGAALVSTVLFDHEQLLLHDRLPLSEVPAMTAEQYQVRGSTALLDAVGETLERTALIHKYARREDLPERTLVVITTDGMENASRKYDYDRVKALIESRKGAGWEFLFLGANMDAAAEAARFGISQDRAVRYKADKEGTALNFQAVGDAFQEIRNLRPLTAKWKSAIEDDVKKRGK